MGHGMGTEGTLHVPGPELLMPGTLEIAGSLGTQECLQNYRPTPGRVRL